MRLGYARPVCGADGSGDVQGQVEALHAHGCSRVIVEEPHAEQDAAPKLNEALDKAGRGDVLVICKLSTISISLSTFLSTLQSLDQNGIGLISIADRLDTTQVGGAAVFAVATALGALMDEANTSQRRKPASGNKKANARSGRPKALSEEEFELAKRLITKTSMTMAEIAERLDVAPATLYRYFPGGRNAIDDGR